MTEPTTPDAPLPVDPTALPADEVPDPVVATAPTAPPAPDDEADDVLDAPETAPGFPPAPGGTPGVAVPPQRPI